jgi:molybdenum cofactor cytidylyltransferase
LSMKNITGIILAAGNSARMGRSKPLLRLDGRTFTELIAENLLQAGVTSLIIVAGKDFDELGKIESLNGYRLIENNQVENGQLYSLQLALRTAGHDSDGCLVALADHPLVKPASYRRIVDEALAGGEKIIIPEFQGRHGHPVFFPARLFAELLAAPLTQGARFVVRNNRERVTYLPVGDDGILKDIDTEERYREWIGAGSREM